VKKRRLLRISDARYDGVNFLDLENATPESLLFHMRGNELKTKTDKKEKKKMCFFAGLDFKHKRL